MIFLKFLFSRTNNSFTNASVDTVTRVLPRGVSIDSHTNVDVSESCKRRKLMASFRQTSVDETRFTPVEKFEPDLFDSIDEEEYAGGKKPAKHKRDPAVYNEDTTILLPNVNNNNNNNNDDDDDGDEGNKNFGKKSKPSPLRRLAFPLSRAMTLPTQTM